jgi:NADH-quinone oxidoreductase subunit N
VNLAAEFSKPSVEYGLLSPLLIIFGVAIVGVLVEAFVARKSRYVVQVVLALVGVAGALVATCLVAAGLAPKGDTAGRGQIAVEGAIAVDGPTMFLWGTILSLALISVLLFAERALEGGITAFAGQAAALPGTEAEREASTKGLEHTEVFPLMLWPGVAGCSARRRR